MDAYFSILEVQEEDPHHLEYGFLLVDHRWQEMVHPSNVVLKRPSLWFYRCYVHSLVLFFQGIQWFYFLHLRCINHRWFRCWSVNRRRWMLRQLLLEWLLRYPNHEFGQIRSLFRHVQALPWQLLCHNAEAHNLQSRSEPFYDSMDWLHKNRWTHQFLSYPLNGPYHFFVLWFQYSQ